jgi:hypothetical protein
VEGEFPEELRRELNEAHEQSRKDVLERFGMDPESDIGLYYDRDGKRIGHGDYHALKASPTYKARRGPQPRRCFWRRGCVVMRLAVATIIVLLGMMIVTPVQREPSPPTHLWSPIPGAMSAANMEAIRLADYRP